jgi:hypothetical protein
MILARVVLEVPGGPNRIADVGTLEGMGRLNLVNSVAF